jgi:dTDP-4-dehydrorhamnose reductase
MTPGWTKRPWFHSYLIWYSRVRRAEKVLVLGGTGFLGGHFVQALGKRAIAQTTKSSYIATEINIQKMQFDRNQIGAAKAFLEEQDCGTVINSIALADIEKCEQNENLANWTNCELPGILSAISKSLDCKFVHISTDAVFDGSASFRNESDIPSPLSIYGKSKWNGEQLVLDHNPDAIVARVNFFGKSINKPSLFNYFYENLTSGNSVLGFTDVYFTPLYANDTVRIIMELIDLKAKGLYHVVGSERISKFQFGVLISEAFNLHAAYLKQGQMLGMGGAELRSSDLSLSNDKIKSLGINLPTIMDGLAILKKSIT